MRPGDGMLSLVTPPGAEIMSIDEALANLNLFGDASQNGTIINKMLAAREELEELCGRAFVTQTWDWLLPRFPDACGFTVPKPPLRSVTHIKYIDSAGAEQTVNASDYIVIAPAGPACTYGRIDLAYGATWPTPQDRRDAVRVRFVAGYGDGAADVPNVFREGLHLILTDAFENRSGQIIGSAINENPALLRRMANYIMRTF